MMNTIYEDTNIISRSGVSTEGKDLLRISRKFQGEFTKKETLQKRIWASSSFDGKGDRMMF